MGKVFKVYDIYCGCCGVYILIYYKYGFGKGIICFYFYNIIGLSEWFNL